MARDDPPASGPGVGGGGDGAGGGSRMGEGDARGAGRVGAGGAGGGPLFHVVMHEPEIPNNTGNIGRTCLVFGCALHLIRPLGFDTSVKALRRAGMDYWARVDVREHDSWEGYLGATGVSRERLWLTSGKVGRPVWEAELRAGDHVVFGKETAGLPRELIEEFGGRVLRYPMVAGERGLNVATAVCAVLTEGVRQCIQRGDLSVDANGHLKSHRV